ncbi:unnamed protein product, partial [Didymodactylos carnosus]
NNHCRCNCGSAIYSNPVDLCISATTCAAQCITNFPGVCTPMNTQGCCGLNCSSYIPTCSCNCGQQYSIESSIPCTNTRTCLEQCTSSYSACTQPNAKVCCGIDCVYPHPSCTCMCGGNTYTTISIVCSSSQQCVQACLQAIGQCTVTNTQACCGSDCSSYVPSCRCQCGNHRYYSTLKC